MPRLTSHTCIVIYASAGSLTNTQNPLEQTRNQQGNAMFCPSDGSQAKNGNTAPSLKHLLYHGIMRYIPLQCTISAYKICNPLKHMFHFVGILRTSQFFKGIRQMCFKRITVAPKYNFGVALQQGWTRKTYERPWFAYSILECFAIALMSSNRQTVDRLFLYISYICPYSMPLCNLFFCVFREKPKSRFGTKEAMDSLR